MVILNPTTFLVSSSPALSIDILVALPSVGFSSNGVVGAFLGSFLAFGSSSS